MTDEKLTKEQREAECNAEKTVVWAFKTIKDLTDFTKDACLGRQTFLEEKREDLLKYFKLRNYLDSLNDS